MTIQPNVNRGVQTQREREKHGSRDGNIHLQSVKNLAEHYCIYSERKRKTNTIKRRIYAHTMSHNISKLWNGNSEPKR